MSLGKTFAGLVLAGVSVCLVTPLRAAEPPARSDAQVLAERIDRRIEARWAKDGVKPVNPADDAEFMRRVYLDLTGRIPRASEARAFLDDTTTNKRARLIDKLLESPGYVNHMTNVWRGLILPEANNLRFLDPNITSWLNRQFRENVTYDLMVRELLTTPIAGVNVRGLGAAVPGNQPTPVAFYQATEFKPENLAATSARLFLGLKLECAQCHDHPFAKHTRKEFWELAAFFAGIKAQGNNGFFQPMPEKPELHEITMPGTDKVIQARFPGGAEPEWKTGASSGRAALASWMTTPNNPYFARAAANRAWAHFFGIGLTDPVDEMNDDNPASHPELLDELGKQFADHKFDMKFLFRAIANSKAYQLSSIAPEAKHDDLRLFRRMSLKTLDAAQLFDSLALATGFREPAQANVRGFNFNQQGPRADFLAKFSASGKRTEPQTSILQALTMMNGKFIGDATDGANLEKTETLAAIADAPFFDTPGKVEALYLTTLSRRPRAEETSRFVRYIESNKDSRAALADVFWALLNSTEFVVNH